VSGDRFAAIVEELDPYHTISEEKFDEIVEAHGFNSEDDELVSRLHDEGWAHCLVFRDDTLGEYVHEKPEPNRFTRILQATKV